MRLIRGYKTRSIYLMIINCSFLLSFALVYKDLRFGFVQSFRSINCLRLANLSVKDTVISLQVCSHFYSGVNTQHSLKILVA